MKRLLHRPPFSTCEMCAIRGSEWKLRQVAWADAARYNPAGRPSWCLPRSTGDEVMSRLNACLFGACSLLAWSAATVPASADSLRVIHTFVDVRNGARPRAALT